MKKVEFSSGGAKKKKSQEKNRKSFISLGFTLFIQIFYFYFLASQIKKKENKELIRSPERKKN